MSPMDTGQRPVGRFAPSPTGDLHFGSLLAALASYCEVIAQNGLWQLRIDDIDGPRSVKGSADAIQRTLEAYGFEWAGPVILQSSHIDHYHDALSTLVGQQSIFACQCSRRSLPSGKVYPGSCRENLVPRTQSPYQVENHALRMHMRGKVSVHDVIQGVRTFDLAKDVGDIIVWRRDGLVSYSLACAVDDASGPTQVVRGADLLDSTGAQMAIMNALELKPPEYAHIPVAIDINGDKLSKHSKAPAIADSDPLLLLLQAWTFLGQPDIAPATLEEFWQQALTVWNINAVPKKEFQQQRIKPA